MYKEFAAVVIAISAASSFAQDLHGNAPSNADATEIKQVEKDNAKLRKDNAQIRHEKTGVARDNSVIGKDKARASADQKKVAEERSERNADQRREDADVRKGDLKDARKEEAKREQENREITSLTKDEHNAEHQAKVARIDRTDEQQELHKDREKKAHDVHKRNQDAAKIN